MNHIYILGKIIYLSNVKYSNANTNLNIYATMLIYSKNYVSINNINNTNDIDDINNIFLCIIENRAFDKYYSKIKVGKLAYIIGRANNNNGVINIICDDIIYL